MAFIITRFKIISQPTSFFKFKVTFKTFKTFKTLKFKLKITISTALKNIIKSRFSIFKNNFKSYRYSSLRVLTLI